MKWVLQRTLNGLVKPYSVVVITVFLSLMAWLTPSSWNMELGYTRKANLGVDSFCMIVIWYMLIVAVSYFSFRYFKKFRSIYKYDMLFSLDDTFIYKIYTLIGITGYVFTLMKILSTYGISALVTILFVDFQGNSVQDALYQEYSIGILSLRYILVICFGIALYRIQFKKEYSILNIANIIIFISYTILLGRRLQILVSLFIFIALANRNKDMLKKTSSKTLYVSIIMAFLLISAASVLRNYNTFVDRGSTNPFIGTIANAIEYMGSPFQAVVSIGNNLDMATSGISYTSFSYINENLQTNSALSTIIFDYGWYSFLYISILTFIYSSIAGYLYANKNNYLFVGYPIIIYAFSEIWRINLFVQGIFFTLLFVSMVVPLAIGTFNRKRI
jgi:hypothetical protein